MDGDDSPRKVDTDITWPNLTYLSNSPLLFTVTKTPPLFCIHMFLTCFDCSPSGS